MDAIIGLLDGFDLSAFLPKISTFMDRLELFVRIAVMAGPLILLGLGLWYFLAPPREANHHVGFRSPWGEGSVEAWQFTQRIAGICYGVLGLILTVVMALICNGYRGVDAMDMLWSAVTCILWEVGLVLAVTVGIHITVMLHFYWDGSPRK